MAKKLANSLSNSMKGKIWLSTVALAFFVCTFGLLSYTVVSFLISDPFYAVFIPFLFLAIMIAAFGFWLSNEIVSPVEKVLLLSKSLERGISTSLPRTSGSTETDELMHTIHRISQQVQRLLHSMDDVAQGNLDTVYTQSAGSDRISTTFQKLLAKVSESIQAKQDLEKLKSAVRRLSEEVAAVRNNNLDVTINSDTYATRDLALTLDYLTEQLGEIVSQVKISAAQSQNSSAEVQKNLQNIIERDETRMQKMNQAAVTLKQVPQLVQKISEELTQSALSANQSIEKARLGTQNAQANINAVSGMRKQIQESVRRIQKLGECSEEIGSIAKTVGDLAHRTNLVALNASIQAAELGEQGRGFIVVSEEIERIAVRADKTNKDIHTLNKSVQAEIEKVENSLEATIGEVANFSKFAIETGNLTGEFERYLTQYLNLQEKIVVYTGEKTEVTEQAFETFSALIDETEKSIKDLRDSAQTAAKITNSMGNLQSVVAHFSSAPAEIPVTENSFVELAENAELNISV